MKPKKFAIGQEVTPNKKGVWLSVHTDKIVPGPHPEFGKIYCVRCYHYNQGDWYVHFNGFVHGYLQDHFDPVVPDKVLELDLKKITEKV